MAAEYLEVRNEKKTIRNKHNLIDKLISVLAWNDKIRNDCVELVHSMPVLLLHLKKSKAH